MPRKSRPKSNRQIREEAEELSSGALRRIARGAHRHTAEIHGESEARGLTRWARRSVLGRVR